MLRNGIKFEIALTQEDLLTINFVVNLLGRMVSFGIDSKFSKIRFSQKDYSFRVSLGPLCFSIINLEKMNKYLNNFLKDETHQDYSEM